MLPEYESNIDFFQCCQCKLSMDACSWGAFCSKVGTTVDVKIPGTLLESGERKLEQHCIEVKVFRETCFEVERGTMYKIEVKISWKHVSRLNQSFPDPE